MSVNKGNRRLLRRLGDSLDTNLIVDGDIESGNYSIEYDTIMKARRKATFENNKFKGVELLNVEKPTALFLPQNNAYLDFTYDYTVDGIDYENTGTTIIPFKWSIEFDVQLTDYYKQGGYCRFYTNNDLTPFQHLASRLSNSNFNFDSSFWGYSYKPEVLDVELKNEDYVGGWYKIKMEVETFENETSYISVDYFGIHHEEESDIFLNKFYGISTTYIGGDYEFGGNYESKYIKNVKIKYNDELILDCPDPVTGKNLVAGGVDATPNNIIYGYTK